MPGFGQPITQPGSLPGTSKLGVSGYLPGDDPDSPEGVAFRARRAEFLHKLAAERTARISAAEPVEPAEPTYSTVELGITAKGDVVWTVKARAEDVHKAAADAQAIHDQLTEKYAGKTGRGDK